MPCTGIVEKGGSKPMDRLLVADAIGRTPSSSEYKRLLSSSRAYGLTTGTEKADYVVPTELGLKIVKPLHPEEALQAKVQACLNIELLGRLWRQFNKSKLPDAKFLKNTLERTYDWTGSRPKNWDSPLKTPSSAACCRISPARNISAWRSRASQHGEQVVGKAAGSAFRLQYRFLEVRRRRKPSQCLRFGACNWPLQSVSQRPLPPSFNSYRCFSASHASRRAKLVFQAHLLAQRTQSLLLRRKCRVAEDHRLGIGIQYALAWKTVASRDRRRLRDILGRVGDSRLDQRMHRVPNIASPSRTSLLQFPVLKYSDYVRDFPQQIRHASRHCMREPVASWSLQSCSP